MVIAVTHLKPQYLNSSREELVRLHSPCIEGMRANYDRIIGKLVNFNASKCRKSASERTGMIERRVRIEDGAWLERASNCPRPFEEIS